MIIVVVNDSEKTLKIASEHIHASNPVLLRTSVLHEKKLPASTPATRGKYLKERDQLIERLKGKIEMNISNEN